MANFIVILILAAILGAAILYLYRQKKRGVKCIGCPEGCSCGKAEKTAEETPCVGGCPGCSGGCGR